MSSVTVIHPVAPTLSQWPTTTDILGQSFAFCIEKENSMDDLSESEEERRPRPFPCPECGSTHGYSRVGMYRSQCLSCNALLKNAEINRENLKPQ